MADDISGGASLHEAAAAIAGTIGNEVLEKTGGDVYRSGQPLRGTPESSGPTSEEIQRTTAPQPPPESKTETPTVEAPKGFGPGGKYKSMEDWEAGTIEAGNTISTLRRELDEKTARLQSIEHTVAPKTEPTKKDPLDDIEILGVPKDPIRQAIRDEFNGMMSEAAKGYAVRAEADRAIISKYPAYQERFPDLQRWLGEHPEVNQEVSVAESQGAFNLAREYAWLRYTQETGAVKEQEIVDEANGQEKAKAQRRADATVTDQKAGHTRDQSSAPRDPKQVTGEELQRVQDLSKAGYERKAWADLLGPLLPNVDFFQ